MKADAAPLSSEQALDDYFTSLLGLEDGLILIVESLSQSK